MIRTDADFLQLAFKTYDNPHLTSVDEFKSDLKRFSHIAKLINRYQKDPQDLQDGLLINHIVITGNCFTPEYAIPMLRYKLSDDMYPVLNTILFYMGWIESSPEDMNMQLLSYLVKRDEES